MFKSLRKVPIQVQSQSENRTEEPGATRGSLISDISRVNQYRHVISEDMNLDILPLEQDMTEGAEDAEAVQVDIKLTTIIISSSNLPCRRSSEPCWY